jgi:hypothetical protein
VGNAEAANGLTSPQRIARLVRREKGAVRTKPRDFCLDRTATDIDGYTGQSAQYTGQCSIVMHRRETTDIILFSADPGYYWVAKPFA